MSEEFGGHLLARVVVHGYLPEFIATAGTTQGIGPGERRHLGSRTYFGLSRVAQAKNGVIGSSNINYTSTSQSRNGRKTVLVI